MEHPGEPERNLEEGPAIQAAEIDRRRLDAVVDFQGVASVGCPGKRQADPNGALADGERLPVFARGPGDEAVKR